MPTRRIVTADLETDPFEYGKMVRPFLGGYYDGEKIVSFWGEDCIEKMIASLEAENEPYVIYVHNGGRFDFFYFVKHFRSSMRIVNGRIIQAATGKHEWRDSFAIMPFPLADYDKDQIDYEKFRAEVREQHREEIMRYFRKDLTSLHELVTAFHAEFGDKLTIGSASMKQIKLRHKFSTGSTEYDAKFRKNFYYGGRNQVFQSGVIKTKIKIEDVNSMYPYVMKSYLHPIGVGHSVSNRIERDTVFVVTEGKNYGAFPTREKDGSLNFTREYGIFHTTIHEYNAALDTGCFKPRRIIKTYGWANRGTFEEFVSHFYNERAAAKLAGNKIRTIFYKYVLNSGYGKFAQNPDNYFDWYITPLGETPPDQCDCECHYQVTNSCKCEFSESHGASTCVQFWTPNYRHDDYLIWQRPLQTKSLSWYNVATGASITGAARAVLLRGIHGATNPLYCDTDSIICSDLARVRMDDSELGAWKLEGTGRLAAIAGKKLYAVFDRENPKEPNPKKPHECNHKDAPCPICGLVKKAHKGARLTGLQILRIAQGEEIDSCNPVPAFKWDGTYTFTKRTIRATGNSTRKR